MPDLRFAISDGTIAVGGLNHGLLPDAAGFVVARDSPDTVVVRGRGNPYPNLDLILPPNALFEPTALCLRSVSTPDPEGELSPRSAAVVVEPLSVVLYHAATVAFDAGPQQAAGEDAHLGLFLLRGHAWSFVSRDRTHRAFVGSTRRLGTFAVFADTTAPRIVAAPETRWRRPGAAADLSRAPRLSFIITDHGAGLAPADQSIFIDGRRVPAEYDPEASRLNWYPRAWPRAGRHEVRIEAVDRLGNRSVRVVALAVDSPTP
jgi:hypothetical protein